MKYVEAFSLKHQAEYQPVKGETSLFLGGGITGCEDWQARVVEALKDTNLVLLNPRRENWPMGDPAASQQQIDWEYDHLQRATKIMFWFSPETLCPITLFELGKWVVRNKPLYVGCHPEYLRKLDVECQTIREQPHLKIFSSVDEIIQEILRTN